MSHVVSIQSKVKDQVAIRAACRRLGLAEPVHGTAKLYSGEATGLLLRLPGWTYPAVINTVTGEIQTDTFEGNWGDLAHLDKFLQIYAVEMVSSKRARRATPSASRRFPTAPLNSRSSKEDKPMSALRRRLIRPAPQPPPPSPQRLRQIEKLRASLQHERAALARWQTKLTRAFNTVKKSQRQIARLERQLANLEN